MYYDEETWQGELLFINEIYSLMYMRDIKRVDKIEDVEMRGKTLDFYRRTRERIYPRDKSSSCYKI